MAETLEAIKARLRTAFLGKGGIHAIGMSRIKGEIRLYVGLKPTNNEAEVVAQVRLATAGHPVVVIREERATTGSDPAQA